MIDLSFYKKHGYQILRQLLPKEKMASIAFYLEKEKKNVLAMIHEYLPFDTEQHLVDKVGELLKAPEEFAALDAKLKQCLCGHYPLEVRLSDQILSVLEFPVLRSLYSQIFPNEPPKVHLPPAIRFVLPKNYHAKVPPHQDITYNKHMDNFFIMWTPFTSINSSRGGVEIFPGTQNLPEQIEGDPDGFWFKGLEIQNNPIHFEMNLGDVLIFNHSIVHQSRPNLSDQTRISVDFRFFSGTSKKHYKILV